MYIAAKARKYLNCVLNSVKQTKSNLLVIRLLQKLHDDLFVGLQLQKFERQAKKRSWFDISSINTTNVAQFNTSVDN